MEPMETNQNFCVAVTLGTGDASKELMPAATGVTYVVTGVFIIGLVAAAQTLYVGDADATNKVLSYPASQPAVGACHSWRARKGVTMKTGQALQVKPAAAGPSVFVVCEGYILR